MLRLGRPAAITIVCRRASQPRAPRWTTLAEGLMASSCMEVVGCSSCPHGDPALPSPSTGTGDSQSRSRSIVRVAQALQFGRFYVRFPQIFQFAGPEGLEVALGADSHKFRCLLTPPPSPSLKYFSPASVPGWVLVPSLRRHSCPARSPHATKLPCCSWAGNAAIHTKSRIASDPNAN